MLTIKTVENIKLGSRITYFNGIYAVLTGLYYIIFYNWILKANLRAFNSVWTVFSKYNPDLAMLFIKTIIIQGMLIIALGLCIIYLSAYISRRKDRSAWVALFFIGLILWGGLLTIEILNYNFLNVALAGIGWLMFIVGMLIPIRYYLDKANYEY
jgi:hypothetical protein